MTREAARARAARPATGPQQASQGRRQSAQPVSAAAPSGQGSIFSKQDREAARRASAAAATGPGTGSNGQHGPAARTPGQRRRSWSRSRAGTRRVAPSRLGWRSCHAAGNAVASVGDPRAFVFIRSSAKPFQLAPFVASGRFDAYDFPAPTEALAIMAASPFG